MSGDCVLNDWGCALETVSNYVHLTAIVAEVCVCVHACCRRESSVRFRCGSPSWP